MGCNICAYLQRNLYSYSKNMAGVHAFPILRVRFQHLQNGMELILPYIIPSIFTHAVSSDQ